MEAAYGLLGVDRGSRSMGAVFTIFENFLDSSVKLMDGKSPFRDEFRSF